MDILDEFFDSKENQGKYGFEYYKDESGFGSIIFDGDIYQLMNTAYESLGFTRVDVEKEMVDPRPLLNIQVNKDGMLILKDTGDIIEVDVDGEGSEPNFYIRFTEGNDTVIIRFNMVDPELYPDDQCYAYRLPNTSLTAINDLFGRNFPMLVRKWNLLRKESAFELERIPNYRAINRVR